MWKLLTHNWPIKVACLTVASLLWVFVSASQSTLGKFPSSISVKAINVPSGLTTIYDAKTVDIKIMADPVVWRQLSAEAFSAYIDLSGASAGTISLPVNVVSSVQGVQIVEKNPETVLISLEPIVSKEVGINKKVTGSAAEGLTAGSIDLSPDKVVIKGAKSIIDNLTEASVTINLNGESEDFKKTVLVSAFDEKGEVIKGIEYTPPEVTAEVAVVKASNNKTVGVKVKTVGSPKSGYYVASLSVSPSVVDVIGPRTVLSEISFVETEAIDLAEQSATFDREIALNPASGITLQTGTPQKVKVRINLAQNELSREMTAEMITSGLADDYKIVTITPAQVKIIVSGSAEAINNLKSTDVVYRLDLQGKGVGIYNFNINASDINLPQGLVASSILPSAISISLEKK